VNPTDDDARVFYLLQRINALNAVKPAELDPFRDWTPKADSLIQKQRTKYDFIDSANRYPRKSFIQAH
jgi:hypothetical protein